MSELFSNQADVVSFLRPCLSQILGVENLRFDQHRDGKTEMQATGEPRKLPHERQPDERSWVSGWDLLEHPPERSSNRFSVMLPSLPRSSTQVW
jgi:hypothetical protein